MGNTKQAADTVCAKWRVAVEAQLGVYKVLGLEPRRHLAEIARLLAVRSCT